MRLVRVTCPESRMGFRYDISFKPHHKRTFHSQLAFTMSSHRKSVAFSEDTTVVASNGEVTEVNGTSEKTSAESHSTGTLTQA